MHMPKQITDYVLLVFMFFNENNWKFYFTIYFCVQKHRLFLETFTRKDGRIYLNLCLYFAENIYFGYLIQNLLETLNNKKVPGIRGVETFHLHVGYFEISWFLLCLWNQTAVNT